jgi:hypothetical protein
MTFRRSKGADSTEIEGPAPHVTAIVIFALLVFGAVVYGLLSHGVPGAEPLHHVVALVK